jgi:hypothetical protein
MISSLIAVLLLLLMFVAARLWGGMRWRAHIATLMEKVSASAAVAPGRVNLAEVDTLPSPVRGYFHHVLQDGSPFIGKACLRQRGGFRVSPKRRTWSAMEAVQRFTTSPRAFVWAARISMLPGVIVNVCDMYREGGGQMRAELFNLIPLVDAADDARLSSAALQRYLAESVWFPTALLPSQGVSWEGLDDNRARATLCEAGITVSLEFNFNVRGEVESVYTPGRYREVKGRYELTPWQGRFGRYIDVEGYQIPSTAEVAWLLQDEVYAYWKADEIVVRYER